jgi:polyisoprenyl-phosphate glycosyltransferase
MSEALDLSVVIPVYRSEVTLRALVERLRTVLDATGMSYEVVLVDDGSPDGAWRVLEELQAGLPDRIVAIQLMRNYGQHNALMCGFRHARGRLVLTMDDDLQNPPEEIPKLLDAIQTTGSDLVYGNYDVKEHRLWRNLSSRIVNGFYRLVFRSPVTVTSFRVIRRELLETIFDYSLNFTFVDGLLAWNTQRIAAVLVEHHPRANGRSGYSLSKLAVLALNLFTNFSLLPLQLVSACGLLAAAGGFAGGLYYLVRFAMSGITVPGYASMILATLVLGGTQLLALGVIGEYVGRLHLNVNRKPQYSLRSKLSGSGAASPPESGNLGAKRGVIYAETSAPSQANIPFPAAFGRGAMGRGQAEVVREIFRK